MSTTLVRSLLACLLATPVLAGSNDPAGETVRRTWVVEGELQVYPPGISGLQPGASLAPAGAHDRRDLLLRLQGTADLTMRGAELLEFYSDPLSVGAAPLLLARAGGESIEVADLVVGSPGEDGWTLFGGSGDLLGRPVFSISRESLSLRWPAADRFVLSGELLLHPSSARGVGLAASSGAPVGAMVLSGSTHPFNALPRDVAAAGPGSQSLGVIGPDVVVSGVGSTLTKNGTVGSITAYSMTTVSCNVGDQNAIWIDCPSGSNCNQHPVIGQQMYRLKTVDGATRFEQVGLAWLKHGWCAADAPSCGSPYTPHGSCDWLGLFATDTYGAGLNAAQDDLGPRSEISPWTGVFPYPYVLNWNLTGNAIYKRLQIENADLDPSLNAGASYVAEVTYIATDEQPARRYNNSSWRPVIAGAQSNTPPGSNLVFTGSTVWQQNAMDAWVASDTGVSLTNVDVPGDGRFILGSKVTDLGGGKWHYEYALYNMHVDAAAGSISIPVPGTTAVTGLGFHDVFYHSGEPYSGTDWTPNVLGGNVSWATETFAQNVNANAVRWSTTYNFRFDANAPPTGGTATIGLFKTGGSIGASTSVPSAAADPGAMLCEPGLAGVIACPCSNPPSGTGRGCDNSAATGGARLLSAGSASIANDTLTFNTFDQRPTGTSILLQGDAVVSAGSVFGQGLRCVGGNLKRLFLKTAAGGSITAPQPGDDSVSVRSAALGDTLSGGASRHYLGYYRDPVVLGGCPVLSTFNATQGRSLTWSP